MSTFATSCIHKGGLKMFQTRKCEAGVDINQFSAPGESLGDRMPCFGKSSCNAVCEKFETPSAEKVAEHEAWINRRLEEVTKINPLVSQLKKDNPDGGNGQCDCPICENQKSLSWGISSYNGHIHMRCETENCINLME